MISKYSRPIKRMILILLFFLIICHYVACTWKFITIFSYDNNNWINHQEIENESDIKLYIASLYWTISTVVTVGYGDIVAQNVGEQIFTIIIIISSIFFFSFLIGNLTSLLIVVDKSKSSLLQKLEILKDIRQKYQIDVDLYSKLKKCIKCEIQSQQEQKLQFLEQLPQYLRQFLSYEMFKTRVKQIEFLKNKQSQLIAAIGPFLQPLIVIKGQCIAKSGEYANEMFFIKKGTVSLAIKEFNDFKFMFIQEGYYFGEMDLIFGETIKFSYFAETNCELYTINKTIFLNVFFKQFRKVGQQLYKNAIKRRIRVQKQYKEAVEHCIKLEEKSNEDQKCQQNSQNYKQKIKQNQRKLGKAMRKFSPAFLQNKFAHNQDIQNDNDSIKTESAQDMYDNEMLEEEENRNEQFLEQNKLVAKAFKNNQIQLNQLPPLLKRIKIKNNKQTQNNPLEEEQVKFQQILIECKENKRKIYDIENSLGKIKQIIVQLSQCLQQ